MIINRFLKILILPVITATSFAQLNLQQHYDLGRDIQTSTIEFFGTDKLGSEYFFVDINYDRKGASDTYFEIARYFTIPGVNRFSLSLQYNDGVLYSFDQNDLKPLINQIWLCGFQYIFEWNGVTLPMDFLIKYGYGDTGATFQYTVVWLQKLIGEHFRTSGVMDIWTNDTQRASFSRHEKISTQIEAQFYMEYGNFAVGTELEIDRAFNGAWTSTTSYFKSDGTPRYKRVFVIPTIFIKWIL